MEEVSQTPAPQQLSSQWSEHDRFAFDHALCVYGKDFPAIGRLLPNMVGRLPLATTATGMAGPGDAARAERVAAMRKEKEVLAKMLAEAEESEASLDGRLACGAAAYHDLLAKLGQSIESMQTLHSATKEWGQRSAKLWQAAA